MTVPALIVRLAVEHEPSVYLDALTDADEARVWDWIGARDDLAELVARALDLAERERAA